LLILVRVNARLQLMLVFVAATLGCRRQSVSTLAAAPKATAAVIASPDLAEASPPRAESRSAAEPERTQEPTDAEIRAQLDPLFPEIARCVLAASKRGPGPLELRFTVFPATGKVRSAEIGAAEDASRCAMDVLEKLELPRWRDGVLRVSIELSADGKPVGR
jgi:hypothetical protein